MAMAHLEEPSRTVPVFRDCDVAVVGGGIAGVAAALSAARNGASVVLVERLFGLGGLATLGNVTYWLSICDGHGHRAIGGIAEELLKLSVQDLGADDAHAHFRDLPACWKADGNPAERSEHRYMATFNPWSYALALEQAVLDAGVALMYDTRLCAVRREADRVTHLTVENKSGRGAIACRTVVDASGDADACALAGEQTESLDTNVPAGWFYTYGQGVLQLRMCTHPFDRQGGREGAVGPFFRGDDGDSVTDQLTASRALLRARLAELRAATPEANLQLVSPPTLPGLRMTRRLVGAFELNAANARTAFDDTVGLFPDERPGLVYAIPLRALRGTRNCNLLSVGRCASVGRTLWDVARLIPACAVTGEAAGAAAALAARQQGGDVGRLSTPELQTVLRKQGMLLEWKWNEP